MEKEDFEFDCDKFSGTLATSHRAYEVVKQRILSIISDWPTLAQSMLGGKAKIEIKETKNISGSVLGKKFEILFGLRATDNFCRVEAVILIPTVQGDRMTEAGRFCIDTKGSVFSSNDVKLLHEHEEVQSYTLLTAVLRKVLSTRQAV